MNLEAVAKFYFVDNNKFPSGSFLCLGHSCPNHGIIELQLRENSVCGPLVR